MAGPGNPDLQSILATLSQFAPRQATPPSQEDNLLAGSRSGSSELTLPGNTRVSELQKREDSRPRPQGQTVSTAKPIDPATIISWQEGIRCVTKIAAQNAQFAVAIRKMMEEQRRHEMMWYKERQALKQTQKARASSSAQAMTILQSLGSQASNSPDMPKVDSTAELAEYDRKVYAAQQRMDVAMTAELKGLGVPFFGTNEDLVVSNTSDPHHNQSSERGKKTVTELELLTLRRKMVGHLEDLYRD